jgi:hypothetical protein
MKNFCALFAFALAAACATPTSASAQPPVVYTPCGGTSYYVQPYSVGYQPVYTGATTYYYPSTYYPSTSYPGYSRGWYRAYRGGYSDGPRYGRYRNIIINRRRWGDIENYVSYGDLIRW